MSYFRIIDWYTSRGIPGFLLRMTSAFGWRIHPVHGDRRHHNGIDFGGGARYLRWPVPTPAAGMVVFAGWLGGFGNTVMVQMADGNQLIFAHLDTILVKKGDRVRYEQPVGGMGTSGNSTGVHLHFEIRKPPRTGGAPYNSDVWGNPNDYKFPVGGGFIMVAGAWISITAKPDLNVRKTPGTDAAVVAKLPTGTIRQIIADAKNGTKANGHTWWRVQEGWVSDTFLAEADYKVVAKQLQDELAKAQDSLKKASADLAKAKDETVLLKSQLGYTQGELQTARDDADKLRAEIKELDSIIGLLRDQVAAADAVARQQDNRIHELGLQLTETGEMVEVLKRTVDTIMTELQLSSDQNQALAEEVNRVQLDKQQLISEKAKLAEQLTRYKRMLVVDVSWIQLVELAKALLTRLITRR